MEKPKLTSLLHGCLRLGLGGLFVYAGAVKVIDPPGFLSDVQSYRLLPHTLAVATVFFLPWIEICCGAALWLKRAYRGALAILVMLTVIFGIVLVSAWTRGLDISCGCFGISGATEANYPWLLTRDLLIFLGLAGLLLVERARDGGLLGNRRPPPAAQAETA